jgi:hypothetical protein
MTSDSIRKAAFTALLAMSAWLARRELFTPVTRRLMRLLGDATVRAKRIGPQTDVGALGREWQRSFPSLQDHPVTRVDATTAYAEIHTDCPLRGTGDTAACHRLMGYDRTIAGAAGGTFVVLRSQAEPGVQVCQVAMRMQGATTDDLVPAHTRTAG